MQGARMTLTTAYQVIHTYIATRLAPMAVIQAFQNAPAPATPYVSVARPTATPKGTEHKWTSTVETVRTQYEGSMQLWATVGTAPGTESAGDILRRVLALLASTKSVQYFSKNGIAMLAPSQVIDMPRVNGTSYVEEATVKLAFRFCDDATETSTIIAFENITHNIGST